MALYLQEYPPTPLPAPRPGFDLSGWTDPLVSLPVLALFVALLTIAIVLAVALIASQSTPRKRPPIEST